MRPHRKRTESGQNPGRTQWVITTAEVRAELIEIDENLCRAELTSAQRASAIKRRREIWAAMHPKGGRISPTPGGEQVIGFAADTAASTGESKRRINEHLARADALGDDLEDVFGTSVDIRALR